MAERRRDLVVIGGGAAGLVVTSAAAQLGLDVLLVDRGPRLGGDCLHYGCVPSKALLRAAKVASLLRRAGEFGLTAAAVQTDLGAVNRRLRRVIETLQVHDDPERFRGYGAEVAFGRARFTSPHTVLVDDAPVAARRIVIATGSRPALPPVEGLTEVEYLTNESVFDLRRLPDHLIVLGGGPVGVELAQAFARLGARVSLVQGASTILPREDPELSGLLRETLAAEGVSVHTGGRAQRVAQHGGEIQIQCDAGLQLRGDALLVATGRRPDLAELDLPAAGVRHGPRGVEVDARLRSSQKHIYACGDATGLHPYTHVAEYQAGIVVANAVLRVPRRADYRVVPRVTYSDPELAQVGLTEAEARAQGLRPEVLRFSFADLDRAVIEGETTGLVKLVTRRGRLLGASVLGAHAGELIHELALALRTGARLRDISATIHAYPTLAQAARRAVNTGYAPRLFSPGVRRAVRWLNRLLP